VRVGALTLPCPRDQTQLPSFVVSHLYPLRNLISPGLDIFVKCFLVSFYFSSGLTDCFPSLVGVQSHHSYKSYIYNSCCL
jgi:amino acid permease